MTDQNHFNGKMKEVTKITSEEEDTITEAAFSHFINVDNHKRPVQLYYIESLGKWGLKREYEEDDALTYLTWSELEDRLEELINESEETVRIGEYEYDAGRVLRRIDPVAFHQDALAYADSLMDDGYIIEGYNT